MAAGSIGLELAKGTEDPLKTPVVAHAFPALALGIVLLSGGIAVAADGQTLGY